MPMRRYNRAERGFTDIATVCEQLLYLGKSSGFRACGTFVAKH